MNNDGEEVEISGQMTFDVAWMLLALYAGIFAGFVSRAEIGVLVLLFVLWITDAIKIENHVVKKDE